LKKNIAGTLIALFMLILAGCGDNKSTPSSAAATNNNSNAEGVYRRPSNNYPMDCESGHWIASVNRDGEVVILEDGSVWLVDPIDRIDSMLWLPISDIVACYDKLINTDDGETVSARRIR
jgi:hypothetical protein